MVKNFDELLRVAASAGPQRIAVAAVNDAATMTACIDAAKRGVADSILVGGREWIALLLEKIGTDSGGFEVRHEPDPVKASEEAVRAVFRCDTTCPLLWWILSPRTRSSSCCPGKAD